MNILMLLQKDFPPDIRVEKEAQTLIEAGHRVHLLCRNSSGLNDENYQGISVHRMKPVSQVPVLHRIINFPLFCNPFWIRQVHYLIKNLAIDVLHAHDLPMIPLALLAGRGKIPVIYDMHENYPAALAAWGRKDWLSRFIKNPAIAQHIDDYAIRQADHLVVVVDEMKEGLIAKGVLPQKINVVSNRERIRDFRKTPIDRNLIEKYRNRLVLLYAGSFAKDRGLEIPIRATEALRDHLPNLLLLFVGDGPNMEDLKSLVRQIGSENSVQFVGWQPFCKMPSYIAAAAICLVPQPSNAFIDTTIPHKLFQYFAMRRPVLVSDAKPLARVVRELDAGEIFRSGDVTSFVSRVLDMQKGNKAYYRQKTDDEIDAAIDWASDARALLALYAKIRLERGI